MPCLPDRATSPPPHPDDQAKTIAFMAAGPTPGSEPARRIDTHAAMIFLTGDTAWKMKRAVRFPYLDFSTAARRHAALNAELRLNRRTAPQLYKAVHAISRDGHGGLSLDGPGEIVDWVLEMRRFPDEALLASIAARGALDDRLAMRLADRIALFHAGAPIAAHYGLAASMHDIVAGNRVSMACYPGILPGPEVDELHRKTQALLAGMCTIFERRAGQGRVRHCHGDLHLANIIVLDEVPVLFDCLEFDEDLATIDVLYDLAFLLMDLWENGLARQANMVFNRYMDLSPDDADDARLIPLFMSIRAAIRAHVHAAKAEDAAAPSGRQARAYLALASRLLDPVPPRLVAIGGLSGTGKSTLARALGGAIGSPPGARILRTDVLRKRLAGLAPETPLPRASYTAEASRQVYASLDGATETILRAGQSAIADAVFADRNERDAIEAVAMRAGTDFDGLWLEAATEIRTERVGLRKADASDADVGVARGQPPVPPDQLGGWHRIDAGAGPAVTETAARAALAVPA